MVDQHYHQQRGYTESDWTGAQGDPVLADRELGFVTDTGEHVIGDGVTAFSGLTRYGGPTVASITPAYAVAAGSVSPTNTSWQTLSGGPTLDVEVPANGWLMVWVYFEHFGTANRARASFILSGANTRSVTADSTHGTAVNRELNHDSQSGGPILITGLNAGTTTITMQVSSDGGTSSTYLNRRLAVLVGA